MLEVIYILETLFSISSIFLNLFWARLKERPSEIITSAMAKVRRVSLEAITFLEFPSIPKTSRPFEKLLDLLSVVIFDAELKTEI